MDKFEKNLAKIGLLDISAKCCIFWLSFVYFQTSLVSGIFSSKLLNWLLLRLKYICFGYTYVLPILLVLNLLAFHF